MVISEKKRGLLKFFILSTVCSRTLRAALILMSTCSLPLIFYRQKITSELKTKEFFAENVIK